MDATQIAGLAPKVGSSTWLILMTAFVDRSQWPTCGRMSKGSFPDLPRKSIEPIALAAGHAAALLLQQFLADADWKQSLMREKVQRIVARDHAHVHAVGLIDETSFAKKGDKTPGVKRQYCGATGKLDNCCVSVHLSYATPGGFHAQLDSELFLPQDWAEDRERCKDCGIPDDVVYRPQMAGSPLACTSVQGPTGSCFPWITFDEGFGLIPAFLHTLDDRGQRYVGEVPK